MVFHQLNHQLEVMKKMLDKLESRFYTIPIHHLAIIKAGLIEPRTAALTDTFSVAYVTLKYQAHLQQNSLS